MLAAAALRCIGGQMQGRLIINSDEKRARAERMGIRDPRRVYTAEDMASGDVLFAATGVTDGTLLDGVRFGRDVVTTHSIVTRSHTGTAALGRDPAPDGREARADRLRAVGVPLVFLPIGKPIMMGYLNR